MSNPNHLFLTSQTQVLPADRYRLDKLIGSGAVGTVYRAYDYALERVVAIKVLHPDLADKFAVLQRQEVVVAQRVSHPNVVRVHDISPHGIVMEFVPGETLADIISRGPRPTDYVVQLALDVSSGLQAAHAQGIVHSDLKPGNILVGCNGSAKIADFGLAFSLSTLVTFVVARGTPKYMSPEQKTSGSVDARSDIFALGLIMCEMLLGLLPARPAEDILNLIETSRAAPRHLINIIRSCLDHNPERRPTSESLSRALRSFSEGNRSLRALARRTGLQWRVISLVCTIPVACILGAGLFETPKKADSPVVVMPLRTDGSYEAKLLNNMILDSLATSAESSSRDVWLLQDAPPSDALPTGVPRNATIVSGSVSRSKGQLFYSLRVRRNQTERGLSGQTTESRANDEIRKLAAELLGTEVSQKEQLEPLTYYQALDAVGIGPKAPNTALTAITRLSIGTHSLSVRETALLIELRTKVFIETADPEDLQRARSLIPQDASLVENPYMAIAASKFFLASGDTGEANRILNAALRISQRSPELLRELSRLDIKIGDLPEAIRKLLAASKLNPLDWRVYNSLGNAYLSDLAPDDAIAMYKQSVSLTQNSVPKGNLGAAYILAGRYSEAIPLLENAVRQSPSGQAYCNLGQAFWYSGHPDVALSVFERGATLLHNELTMGCLAHAYRWADDESRARIAFRAAANLAAEQLGKGQQDPDLLGRLASYHAALGQQVARDEIKRARAAKISDLDLTVKNAVVDLLLDDRSQARDLVRELVKRRAICLIQVNPDLLKIYRSLS